MSSRTSHVTEILYQEGGSASHPEGRELIKIQFPYFKDLLCRNGRSSKRYYLHYYGDRYRLEVNVSDGSGSWRNTGDQFVKKGIAFYLYYDNDEEMSSCTREEIEYRGEYKEKLIYLIIRDPDEKVVFQNTYIQKTYDFSIGRIWCSEINNPHSIASEGDNLVEGVYSIEIASEIMPHRTTDNHFTPENPICKNILGIFMDEKSADIVFEFKTEEATSSLYAHRAVLLACAPVLAELSEQYDISNPVSILDTSYEIFHHMLFYVYGGKIKDKFYEENFVALVEAADRYGISSLKLEAEAWHAKMHKITLDNVIDTLLWADAKHCALVKEKVMDFFMENKKDVLEIITSNKSSLPPSAATDLLAAVVLKDVEKSTNVNDYTDYKLMRVGTLRRKLQESGLDVDGSREMMLARLEENDRPKKKAKLSS